jgi:starch phosphorylase
MTAWQQKLAAGWNGVSFGPLTVESNDGISRFEIAVRLGGLDPNAVSVELFAKYRNRDGAVRKTMNRGAALPGHGFLFLARIKTDRPASDFTPRVIPYSTIASVPLEANQILWQK